MSKENENIDKLNEMQAKINTLNEKLANANSEIEAHKIMLCDKDKELENNANIIRELKLKNYDLLLKVGTEVVEPKESTVEDVPRLQDITNKLIGGN